MKFNAASWAIVNNHIAKKSDFTLTNLIKQLEAGFKKVTE